MRMSARLRSQMRAAVRPFLRPSSWPLIKASPMSDANAVVTMMMVNGSMCFYFLLLEEARLLFHHASKLGLTISQPPRFPLGIQAANSPRWAKRRII
jgi:hypothetical protein